MTRVMPKLSSVVVVALSLSASPLSPTAVAATTPHQPRPLRNNSPLVRRIGEIDTPTAAPTPKPKPKPNPAPKKKETKTHNSGGNNVSTHTTSSSSSGSSGGSGSNSGSSSSGGGDSSSGGSGGSGSNSGSSSSGGDSSSSGGSEKGSSSGGGSSVGGVSSSSSTPVTPVATPASTPPLGHGESQSIMTHLAAAFALGFVVAGIAFVRQSSYAEKQNAEHANHRLQGSVKQRMNTFSHMIEMTSRSHTGDSVSSQPSDGDSERNDISEKKKGGFLSGSLKKKLVRQLNKSKSVRQKRVEDDIGIDVYTRAEDDNGIGILVV